MNDKLQLVLLHNVKKEAGMYDSVIEVVESYSEAGEIQVL